RRPLCEVILAGRRAASPTPFFWVRPGPPHGEESPQGGGHPARPAGRAGGSIGGPHGEPAEPTRCRERCRDRLRWRPPRRSHAFPAARIPNAAFPTRDLARRVEGSTTRASGSR